MSKLANAINPDNDTTNDGVKSVPDTNNVAASDDDNDTNNDEDESVADTNNVARGGVNHASSDSDTNNVARGGVNNASSDSEGEMQEKGRKTTGGKSIQNMMKNPTYVAAINEQSTTYVASINEHGGKVMRQVKNRRKRSRPRKNAASEELTHPAVDLMGPRKNLKELRTIQTSTELLIRRAPFARLVKEICVSMGADHIKFQSVAMAALQEASESYLVGLFEDSYCCTVHRGRVTL